jgi:pilus assembly protein Flp/PilA
MSLLRAFLRSESGTTAIEYALIAAGISITIVVAVQSIGTNLTNTFTNVSSSLDG